MEEQIMTCEPKGNDIRHMGMHWIDVGGYKYVPLQWNPGSKTWTYYNMHDRFDVQPFDATNFRYVKPIPAPDIGE